MRLHSPNSLLPASPQNEVDAAFFIFSSDSEASPEEQQSDDKRVDLICDEVDATLSDGGLNDLPERFLGQLVHLLAIHEDMDNLGTGHLMDTHPSSEADTVSSPSCGSISLDVCPQCPESWGEQQSQDSPSSIVSDMLETDCSNEDCSIGTPEAVSQPSFLPQRTIVARTAKKVRKNEKRMRLRRPKREV